MKSIVKRSIAVLAACCSLSASCAKSKAKAKDAKEVKDVDNAVFEKYSNPAFSNPDAMGQANWGTLNCHDPKIFQDDDGTYYVYSTDAAIGGQGQKGLQIRSSTDLVHWKSLATSAIQRKWDRDWLRYTNFNMVNASTWAPTIIKQNGLYYLIHGIIVDSRAPGHPDAAITLTIASSATGPFYPANEAASKDAKIAAALSKLGVKYEQSTIVRYSWEDRAQTNRDPKIKNIESFNLASYNTQTGEYGEASWNGGFGGIDPEFVADVATGKNVEYDIEGRKCYGLTYGSWKGGIALIYIDSVSLKPVNPATGEELDVPADSVEGAFGTCIAGGYGAAYEGAQVIYNSDTGYYYCFVSMGALDWEYRVGVGRAKEVTGPYIDGSGKNMLFERNVANDYHAYGSKIIGSCALDGEYNFRCQGGQSILRTADGKVLFACHSRTNFLPGYFFFLQVHQMFFTEDGWPVLNQNEYYEDANTKEALAPLTKSDVAGTYDAILTVRGTEKGDFQPFAQPTPIPAVSQDDAIPTPSKELRLEADGSVSGAYKGKWSLGADGYTVKIALDNIGEFNGYALKAVDWAKKKGDTRKVITFTAIDGENSGEYLWGNKR